MKNQSTKGGFDSSISFKEEDKLGRWAFALELYKLLRTPPKNWSVRVGVYGGWEEGKTTILNLICKVAKKENQAIIWFNPREYQSVEELWETFASLLYKTLNDLKIDIFKMDLEPKKKYLFPSMRRDVI